MKRFILFAIAVLALMGADLRTTASADPLRIRIGWTTSSIIQVLYTKPELLKHAGTSYVIEPVFFRGSSQQIAAVAAGELEIAAFAPTSFAVAILNGQMDLKVIADQSQDGVGNFKTDAFMVRTDSGINSVVDLKGKRIGSNAIGSQSDTAMRVMLKRHGLEDKRDYTVVEMALSNMPAMLEEKKIDLGVVLDPTRTQMEEAGILKVLFTFKDAYGPTQGVFLAGRSDFLAANREQLQDFFEDHVRALRWFMNPANRDEAIRIIAEARQVPPSDLQYLFTEKDYYRDPFNKPNIENLQRMIDAAVEAGALPQPFSVAPDYVDLSFVDEAQRRLEASGE